MATFKTMKSGNYVTIHNEFLEIETLSFTAKGLLAYILSKPDDWKIRKTDLIKKSKGGKGVVETAMLELMAHGFMNWYPTRKEDGTIDEWIYEIYEMPYMNPNKDMCIKEGNRRIAERKEKTKKKNAKKKEQPQSDYPKVDNPPVDNPPLDNPPYSNTDFTKTDNTKKYNTKTDINSLSIDETVSFVISEVCKDFHYSEREINEILKYSSRYDLSYLQANDVLEQARDMQGKDIAAPAYYFAKGLSMRCEKKPREMAYKKKIEDERKRQSEYRRTVPFYNWLEE